MNSTFYSQTMQLNRTIMGIFNDNVFQQNMEDEYSVQVGNEPTYSQRLIACVIM